MLVKKDIKEITSAKHILYLPYITVEFVKTFHVENLVTTFANSRVFTGISVLYHFN